MCTKESETDRLTDTHKRIMVRVVVANNTLSVIQLTEVLIKLHSHQLTHKLSNQTRNVVLREDDMIKLRATETDSSDDDKYSALSLEEDVAHGSLLDPQEPLSILLDVTYPVDCHSMNSSL